MPNQPDRNKQAFELVRRFFKNDYGEPFEMTAGQIGLFRAIYERQQPRIQFDCYTQYGKSDVVSMATLLRASTFREKWIILGATKDKANIIMSKLIKHIFENDYTLAKFEIPKDESADMIRRTRAKDHITFKVDAENIGEVITLSADARKKSQDAGDILIGHGGQNLIEDDAALIPDTIHGKALRMLGGHKDNFLLKITNSFGRNHAYRSRIDPKFLKIIIDYKQGLAEGRLTEEYIEEMRGILDPIMFGVLYECIYPPADMVDDQGWMPILTEEQVQAAMDKSKDLLAVGLKRLGGDIAEGTNFNGFVIRQDNLAKVHAKTQEKDLMKTADYAKDIIRNERITPELSFFDAIGVGAGVVARLHQMTLNVNGIKVGEKPTERSEQEKRLYPIEFFNLKAEIIWSARMWVLQGGALSPHKDWMQIAKIRYKEDVGKRIKIMSKEEMRMRGLLQMSESPDIADAFFLTFAPQKNKKINMVASPVVRDPYEQFQEPASAFTPEGRAPVIGSASALPPIIPL